LHPELKSSYSPPNSLDEMIKKALDSGVRDRQYGWRQDGWVDLARNYGVVLQRRDYGDDSYEMALKQ